MKYGSVGNLRSIAAGCRRCNKFIMRHLVGANYLSCSFCCHSHGFAMKGFDYLHVT